ncbi:class I SAM-dependent methyltransferase [Campylobacter lari]|uniref:Class I SAM-dependent methyltransferase n=1 Tax=Campylobacter lari TaxID=201 RepID=A0A7U8G2C0_CAMLA|nr:class I SAM-dependent methyltransferase [Campylobacter lari]
MVSYRRKKVLEILNKYNPKNVLEIGCGMDSIFNYYKNFDKATIIEPSNVFCHKATNDLKENNVEIFNDFLENKTKVLKDNNFDFIICSSLLHEVNNPDDFLKDILRVCIKGTIIHINVPNSNSFHLLWAYESGLINKLGNLTNTAIKFQQNTTFDLNKLTQFIKNHIDERGCTILDSGSYFIKPFNHSKMSLCLENKILDEKLLDGLYKISDYMPDLGAEIFVNAKIV